MQMKFDYRFVKSLGTFMDTLKTMVETATDNTCTASYEEGYKYVRIVRNGITDNTKSAWGFIDKRTGDIFRAASWKAPCLNHIRGNLYDADNGLKHCHWTGPAYIWEINGEKEKDAPVTITTGPATEVV